MFYERTFPDFAWMDEVHSIDDLIAHLKEEIRLLEQMKEAGVEVNRECDCPMFSTNPFPFSLYHAHLDLVTDDEKEAEALGFEEGWDEEELFGDDDGEVDEAEEKPTVAE